MDARTTPPVPANEPVRDYAPGSAERSALELALTRLASEKTELANTVGGEQRPGGGHEILVVAPHAHQHVLGALREATHDDARRAVDAALDAAPGWRAASFDDRAAVLLRAAELLSGPWREVMNAATMLGQSKTCHQAEIDAACELADFWRFNVSFGAQLLAAGQPASGAGHWNRADYRPLDGFVYAVTPFNFTAVAGNLPTAPALMGNTVVWKPAPTQALAAHVTMRLLEAAGLPPGVVNQVGGTGRAVSDVVLADPALAGLHFTGSTATFQGLWRRVADHLDRYRSYPRLVGETGGKDFVVAHSSADVDVLRTALVRGAFEYSGQKCSAASRAYLPVSLWTTAGLREDLAEAVDGLNVGDVTDFSTFTGAVIDAASYARLAAALAAARGDAHVEVVAGGRCDDTFGWFVRPTVLLGHDPAARWFTDELFGPVLSVHVYDDRVPGAWRDVLELVDATSPYGLTGSVVADDRGALATATDVLRFAAGNLYLNDKPTGAVVGQQPFGGSRASGTNDKAGSVGNLTRWTSVRVVSETFRPPVDHRYPHQYPHQG